MKTMYTDDDIRKEFRFEFMDMTGRVVDSFDIPRLIPTAPRGSRPPSVISQPLQFFINDEDEITPLIDRICRIHGMPEQGKERQRSRRASIIGADIEMEYDRRGHDVTSQPTWINDRKPRLFQMSCSELKGLADDLKSASKQTTTPELNKIVVSAICDSETRRREADDARMAHVPPAKLEM